MADVPLAEAVRRVARVGEPLRQQRAAERDREVGVRGDLGRVGARLERGRPEADAVDESGGELIVTDEDPDAVPVDTPDTPMTNVPPEEAEGDAASTDEVTPDE